MYRKMKIFPPPRGLAKFEQAEIIGSQEETLKTVPLVQLLVEK